MLPEPALSFTIPSLHDGVNLDCRIYHPASLAATNTNAPPWKKHAAILAHPYAPMGGCYDDPILESIAAKLWRTGYLVGTFNFRGAGHSAGRTSWTAKPERDDFMSFVGFIAHYTHFLDPFEPSALASRSLQPSSDATVDSFASARGTEHESSGLVATEPLVLLMGGYSYGAMVTAQLPPIEDLLKTFTSPEAVSNAAQIRLRAQHIAEQQNIILRSMRAAMSQVGEPQSSRKYPSGVRVGGDEGDDSHRKSHESHGRRSFSLDAEDRIRRGFHDFMVERKSGHRHHLPWRQRQLVSAPEVHDIRRSVEQPGPATSSRPVTRIEQLKQDTQQEKLPVIENFKCPRPAYVLVSPLQGLITHLATMSLFSRYQTHDEPAEKKLVNNPTLAVFGDDDVFVPVGKLRTWVKKLSLLDGSQFRGFEVPQAGHFWAEEDVLYVMNEEVGAFAGNLIHER